MERFSAFWRSGIVRRLLLVLLVLSLGPLFLLGGFSLWGQVGPGWALLGVFLVTVGGILFAAYLLSRYLARPLLMLGDVARKVSMGDYSQDVTRLIGPRRDEIGEFSEAFNLMVVKIEARETNLRAQVQRLQIEIDEARKERQVAEITDTDYFQQLREAAKRMRRREVQEGGEE